MSILLRKIKITRLKLAIAKVLYTFVRIFFKKESYIVRRQGIVMELDLNEGIDLHLFLFGNFQKHITDNNMISLPEDGVVLDVGGNAGIISLIFASKVSKGQVHAFEPTDYAIKKFQRNLELNPALKPRIFLMQCFVSKVEEADSAIRAYSSWPIQSTQEKHAVHCGVDMTSAGVKSITLDGYCQRENLKKVDLIKIDTDGHEMEVLQGASAMLRQYQPKIIFEIGGYVMEEHGITMDGYFEFFSEHRYELYTTSGKAVLPDNYKNVIPQFGTVDLVALPVK